MRFDGIVTGSTTVSEILDQLRTSAISEADKGSKFERLMKAFFQTDPVYAKQFSDVWLWGEWPGNGGRHDTGIDLVAQDRNTGDRVAIQCKFYAPETVIAKPDIDSFLSASGKEGFAERIIVSTTDRWNANAEDSVQGQQIPVRRVGLADLEASPIDWSRYSLDRPHRMARTARKKLRPHQRTAIEKVTAGFGERDRGKLIMACGTGKTFTSLRLAEDNVGAGGSVLFLVPSISLLSQTIREWVGEAEVSIRPLAVCSDTKATKRADPNEDIGTVDLALPATTDPDVLRQRLQAAVADKDAMTVVFATYQSIDVVAQAQRAIRGAKQGSGGFDLIVADEAHRTTGVTLVGQGKTESAFVRVHDNSYLPAARRLYMTATPRIYDDASKARAGEANAILASMDNEELYGPEFHRLGFGEAVEMGLLADYKVLVLTVDEEAVARTFQGELSGGKSELQLGDAARIVGCWNGLAKRGSAEHSFGTDPAPMRRAVAFAGTIRDSKRIESLFADIADHYVASNDLDDEQGRSPLACEIRHVDGSFNALQRNSRLDWLKADVPDNTCRILTNARCLSEGVDVPELDAVMFLSPRRSVVDIVQSVGRVMRKPYGSDKQYGYIILPVGVPSGMTPEDALRDNKRYAAVWEVLQALRAHDERFEAMINRIDLTTSRDDKVNVITVPEPGDGEGDAAQGQLNLIFSDLDQWRDAIYSKIVAKVGSRRYWADWAGDVADIARAHSTRIQALLSDPNTDISQRFAEFLNGLRGNLNENITQTDAIDMLCQHLITRPIFNALFQGYDFLDHNPVAQTMERMLNALDEHNIDDENRTLQQFYDSVRLRVEGVDNAEGRQKIVLELYNNFFATAFKKTVDKLGIVYTPIEIVDFILRSADDVLRQEFGQGLTDEGVHILDGFAGTGTFIVRLLQTGLIKPHDVARKYAEELHANEILLLAYYIAAVNIETTYQDLNQQIDPAAKYKSFPGLILTDTFQSWEGEDRPDLDVFPENNDRLERLKKLPITVIVGNPPYSSGQDSANDNNANERYPSLDEEIRKTYADRSTATNKNSLYDSYIRAIKWATLRIQDRGVIGYVTNGGFLDSNTADGMRKTLAEDFSTIYVYNLRGNQRTAGEQSRKEGGKIFGGGSRATVAITLLVKNPATKSGLATIRYTDIGDYLTREEKLAKVAAAGSVRSIGSTAIETNVHGDWLNQRREDFETFLPIGEKGGSTSVMAVYSYGLNTARSAWAYASSRAALGSSLRRLLEAYAESILALQRDRSIALPSDETRIKWSRSLELAARKALSLRFDERSIRLALFRPFQKQWCYFSANLNDQQYSLNHIFPTATASNIGFYAVNPGSDKPWSVLMTDATPDLSVYGSGSGQFFPRYGYQQRDLGMLDLGGEGKVIDGYRKTDNVTDEALKRFQEAYRREAITKDDIFFYVYGLLHGPEYRETYAADLKKMLPRIPFVSDFRGYVDAGHRLSDLHLGYESATPFPLDGLDVEGPDGDAAYDFFAVGKKMSFGKPTAEQKAAGERYDRTVINYNSRITLRGIPLEAYRYMLGSRSAIEWIIDRYYVKTDKASGIVNDPNDWSREVGDPRYILELLARIVTVSLETMKIIDQLPPLDIIHLG